MFTAFCLFLVVGCTHAQLPEIPNEASNRIEATYGQFPVAGCLRELSQTDFLALGEGRSRLVVRIQNDQAWKRYSPNFKLSLISQGNKKTYIDQFSMHPDHVSSNTNKPMAQSFSFDLRDHKLPETINGNLCFELNLEKTVEISTERTLRITFELTR